MNSDEDPSFPYICGGSTGVLEILGESAGVLPVMNSTSEVTDLDAVLAKASIPVSLGDTHQKVVVEKNTTEDVLANFQVGHSVLSGANVRKKVIQIDASVLHGSVPLAGRFQNALIDSNTSLTTADSVLVSVLEDGSPAALTSGGSTGLLKDLTTITQVKIADEVFKEVGQNVEVSATSSAVAGTVELAEEIMEAFANSKTVLDAENPVAADPCSLEEELEKLEQLAVERVREIEGELVNSSKQVSECDLNLDVPKETKATDGDDDIRPSLLTEPISSPEIAEPTVSEISNKERKSSGVTKEFLMSIADVPVVADVEVGHEVVVEGSETVLSPDKSLENLKNSLLLQKDNETDVTINTENVEIDESLIEQEDTADRTNEEKRLGEFSTTVGALDISDKISDSPVEKNECKHDENKDTEVVSNVQNIEEVVSETDKITSNDKIEPNNARHQKLTLEASKSSEAERSMKAKKVQNYETEDDDLDVLEAFIVKSATDPELAVCPMATEQDTTTNYTLESTLIDDLTKTDNGNGSNGGETTGDTEKETLVLSDPLSPQTRLSQALERASQIFSALDSTNAEADSESIGRLPKKTGKVGLSRSGKLIPKKLLSQKPTSSAVAALGGSDTTKDGADRMSSEKTVVTVEVKRRRGRPPGSTKKAMLLKRSLTAESDNKSIRKLEIESDDDDLIAEKKTFESADVPLARKSAFAHKKFKTVPKRTKFIDLDKPSTSGIVMKKRRGRPPSALRRVAKIDSDEDSDSSSSSPTVSYVPKRKIVKKVGKKTFGSAGKERKFKKVSSGNSVPETFELDDDDDDDDDDHLICSSSALETDSRTKMENKEKKLATSSLNTAEKMERKVKLQNVTPVSKKTESDEVQRSLSSSQPGRQTKQVVPAKKALSPKRRKIEKDKENVEVLNSSSAGEDETGKGKGSQCKTLPVKDIERNNTEDQDVQSTQASLSETARIIKRTAEYFDGHFTMSKHRRIETDHLPNQSRNEKETDIFEKETDMFEKETDMFEKETDIFENNLDPEIYSDDLFYQFEEITYDMLKSKAKQLVLPTSLWGAQVSTVKDLIIFSRLRADLSDNKSLIDKAIVFQGSLRPLMLINNEPVYIPIPQVRTFEDVVLLIRNFHSVSFCEGTGVKQRPLSKYCFRYLDVANPGRRCSQCLEERRRVLFSCARKLKERLRCMREGRSQL